MRIKSIFPLLVGFFLLTSILLSSPAYMQGQRGLTVGGQVAGRYYALVIGNNAYTSLPRLKTAEADAREVAALLKDAYGFETKLLLNATRSQIVSALSAYRLTLAPDANLLIYYAGHGINDKEADKAYWLPVDASREDSSNWIIADEITTGIKVIPAKHVLIISDSCYSGTLTRGLGDSLPRPTEREQFLRKMQAGKSRTLMASGGDEPVADGGGGGKHSVFANALLRGLREIDKGQFTAAELFRYHIEEVVAGRANQTPEYNPLRNSGHEAGDFIFVKIKTDGKNAEVTVKAPASPAAGAAFDPAAIELSFWESIKGSTDAEDFQSYLNKYPDGVFSDIAKRRIHTPGRVPLTNSVNQVLENYFRSIGGKDFIKQMTTIEQKGTIEITQGDRKAVGVIEHYQKKPDKILTIQKFGKNTVKEVFDGDAGWLYGSTTGTKPATAQQLALVRRLVAWGEADIEKIKQLYSQIVLKEKEKIGEREAFVVAATLPNSRTETLYFDTKTGLLLRMDIITDSVQVQQGIALAMQIYFEDYIEVNAVKIPMTIRQIQDGGFTITSRYDITKLKFNTPLDDKIFGKPSK